MSELLSAPNYDPANILAETTVDQEIDAGDTSVMAENEAGFNPGSFIVVGEGEEAELKQITTLIGQQINIDGEFQFQHYKGEKIIELVGDSVRFYVATNIDGTSPETSEFSLLPDGQVSIVPDELTTEYLHSDGGSGYWYKYVYYNSDNADQTDLEDSIAVRGGNFGHITDIEQVKEEAGMETNPWLKDTFVFKKLMAAESEAYASLTLAGYDLPLNSVPEIVVHAVNLIAAGYVLLKNYGPEHSGTNKDGQSKVDEGRAILKKIEDGDMPLVGVDQEPVITGVDVSGYPDSSAAGSSPSEAPFFTIADKF